MAVRSSNSTFGSRQLTLSIGGMTCASCVARVERKLAKLPGVTAVVNLATESAQVTITAGITDAEILAQITAAGYHPTVKLPEISFDSSESATTTPPSSQLRLRFFLCLTLTLPIVALSMLPLWQFSGWQWLVAALSLPVTGWGAWPFHRAALKGARHLSSTMDTLVSLGVTAATVWSLWALLLGGAGHLGMTMEMSFLPRNTGHHMPELYFESAAMVTTFLLAGRWAESRSRRRAGAALRELLTLGAKDAVRLIPQRDGHYRQEVVPADAVSVGDLILARPGEKIPVDGSVIAGDCAVDTSLVTGESLPVEVSVGDLVRAGTIATSGALTIRAEQVGNDTLVAQIGAMVSQAQATKAPIQRLADRISAVFVPIVLILAVLTFLGWWYLTGTAGAALPAAVAVLVIACPCALGLATPTALLVGTGRAAHLGIVIKGPELLESTRIVDTIVWDKTGTLTEDRMVVCEVIALPGGEIFPDGYDSAQILTLAAAAEESSAHPIARAIVAAANAEGLAIPHATRFTSTAGLGVTATTAGAKICVGNRDFLAATGVTVPEIATLALNVTAATGTLVWVAQEDQAIGVIVVAAPLRPTAQQAIAQLRALGIDSVLLTGDAAQPAAEIARQLGIKRVYSGVLPGEKRDIIAALQQAGQVTAMVGDGVNDAAALAQAGVQGLGIAMGSGSDLAIASADLTLVRCDPLAVPTSIQISRATLKIIKQNLFWAFSYNVAAIPLAIAGLLNPAIAGAAMACSSIMVVTNSLRLRRIPFGKVLN